MFFGEFRRLTRWLFHSRESTASSGAEPGKAASASEFDPMWHGDHWQNLLSSPMDARRYVMEDWSVSSGFELAAASPTASGN
ncbi:hypothetical protein P3T23_004010 [Paraburkholderia sp. GAS448]|uniref:hypothetical protein n=1 Tax=Paraburkholderia sp. GAS448 TaxID=3035136 RepID=UPI003D1EB58D